MGCTSCYNENNLCVCYTDWNRLFGDLFVTDKVGNTAAGGGIAIGSNS